MLQRTDIRPNIRAAALQIEHDIRDPLPRPVIGEFAATPCAMHGKSRLDEVAVLRARARRVKRGMLHEPDPLGRAARGDRLGERLHFRDRVRIGRQSRRRAPFDRRRIRGGQKRRVRVKTGVIQVENLRFG